MSNQVMVMTVPSAEGADLRQIREYVRESLATGILVVGRGVSWEIVDMPPLGGLVVMGVDLAGPGEKDITPVPPAKPEAPPPKSGDAAEKRRISGRLHRWRDLHGLGSLQRVAEASDGWVSEAQLRDALSGSKLALEVWTQIDRALVQAED